MEGNIGYLGQSEKSCMQSMADWDDTIEVTIGTDDINIPNTYPDRFCKAVQNIGPGAATVKYRTSRDLGGADQTFEFLAQNDQTTKQPAIRIIRGSDNGSTSGAKLKLYLQNVKFYGS